MYHFIVQTLECTCEIQLNLCNIKSIQSRNYNYKDHFLNKLLIIGKSMYTSSILFFYFESNNVENLKVVMIMRVLYNKLQRINSFLDVYFIQQQY